MRAFDYASAEYKLRSNRKVADCGIKNLQFVRETVDMFFKMIQKNFHDGEIDEKIFDEIFEKYLKKNCPDGSECHNLAVFKKSLKFFIDTISHQKEVKKNNEDFWASVFHDLKSPMMSINLALSPHFGDDEFLKEIYHLNANNLQFIQDLLEYYNFENGFYEYKIEPVCLNEVLDEKLAHFKYFMKEKDLTFRKIGFEEKYIVNFYSIGISRIFANLISNAIKFSCRNSEIVIETKKTKDGTLVSFFDHGEKIRKGSEREIFKKFKTTAKNSNGLGLFICKKLMDEFGGKIWAENHKDGVCMNALFVN